MSILKHRLKLTLAVCLIVYLLFYAHVKHWNYPSTVENIDVENTRSDLRDDIDVEKTTNDLLRENTEVENTEVENTRSDLREDTDLEKIEKTTSDLLRENTDVENIKSDLRENTDVDKSPTDFIKKHNISQNTKDRREKANLRQSTGHRDEQSNVSKNITNRNEKSNVSTSYRHEKSNASQNITDHNEKTNVNKNSSDRQETTKESQNISDQREKHDKKQTVIEGSVTEIRETLCDGCFPHPFDFVINNKHICTIQEPGLNIDLFIMIFTCHENFENRQAIRQTWLSITKENTANVRYVFLLGKVENKALTRQIARESEVYKDIIEEDFYDSYRNQTIKTIMGFKWAVQYCREAKFVMKADDDTFVNVENLLTYIRTSGKNEPTQMIGSCRIDGPIRDPTSKWHATVEEYREPLYPWHCSGTGYLTTFTMVEKMYNVSPNVPYFWLEDIYVSLCFMAVGGKVKHMGGFNRLRVKLDPCIYKSKNIYTSHEVTPKMLLRVWNEPCTDYR